MRLFRVLLEAGSVLSGSETWEELKHQKRRENSRIYPSKMKAFMRYSWVLKG
jgi:hypothetical protein